MSYKPAYMLFLNREIKAFVGNYDSLADVRYEHSKDYFFCWEEKDAFYIRRLTEQERKEAKRAS
jgi:hypothetical protein